MHQLLIDFRDGFTIYDPNIGYEGRKYYTAAEVSYDENAVPLKGFRIDYEIIDCPAMRD